MLCLYLQAPFGAFRPFTAGSFRPTAEFITYSAAYGLLLNVAGVEMRRVDPGQPMTLIRPGLPRFRLAIGAVKYPEVHTIYQQLHNYPVGSSNPPDPEHWFHKHNIAPVRRAFLSDIRAYLGIEADEAFEQAVRDGLEGREKRAYGLPFLGDNAFLLDRLEPVDTPQPAHWYVPVGKDDEGGLDRKVTRLTITIDRADMSRTRSALFAPTAEKSADIPGHAWVEVGY